MSRESTRSNANQIKNDSNASCTFGAPGSYIFKLSNYQIPFDSCSFVQIRGCLPGVLFLIGELWGFLTIPGICCGTSVCAAAPPAPGRVVIRWPRQKHYTADNRTQTTGVPCVLHSARIADPLVSSWEMGQRATCSSGIYLFQ